MEEAAAKSCSHMTCVRDNVREEQTTDCAASSLLRARGSTQQLSPPFCRHFPCRGLLAQRDAAAAAAAGKLKWRLTSDNEGDLNEARGDSGGILLSVGLGLPPHKTVLNMQLSTHCREEAGCKKVNYAFFV